MPALAVGRVRRIEPGGHQIGMVDEVATDDVVAIADSGLRAVGRGEHQPGVLDAAGGEDEPARGAAAPPPVEGGIAEAGGADHRLVGLDGHGRGVEKDRHVGRPRQLVPERRADVEGMGETDGGGGDLATCDRRQRTGAPFERRDDEGRRVAAQTFRGAGVEGVEIRPRDRPAAMGNVLPSLEVDGL